MQQRPDRSAAEVGTVGVAVIGGELRIDDPQTAAPVKDRSPAAALEALAGGVAVDEPQVLDVSWGSA